MQDEFLYKSNHSSRYGSTVSSASMASEKLLVLMTFLSIACSGNSLDNTIDFKCWPAVGVIGESMKISCSIESTTKAQTVIYKLAITRLREKTPLYIFYNDNETGDLRFQLREKSNPTLMLHHIALSDEGKYKYQIWTNKGMDDVEFTINVTAQYKNISINTWPKDIEEKGKADLHCNASAGYPAGTIHWFGQRGTNWTENAELKIKKRDDGLFDLSSKLSFQSVDSMWGSLRCVVLNYKLKSEEEALLQLKLTNPKPGTSKGAGSNVNHVVAPVIVIGSLIIGLLIALIYTFRRRRQREDSKRYYPGLEEEGPDAFTDKPSSLFTDRTFIHCP